MKAVRQIIDYLCREGVLCEQDLASLAGGGFVGWHEVYQPEPSAAETEPNAEQAETWLDALHDEAADSVDFARRPGRARAGRKVVRKGPLLDEKGLLRRLRDAFGSWSSDLVGLERLAHRLSPQAPWPSWQEAAVIIRKSDPASLTQAIERGLEQRNPAFDALWGSLAMESYRSMLAGTGTARAGGQRVSGNPDFQRRHAPGPAHQTAPARGGRQCIQPQAAQRKTLTAMEPIFVQSRHLFDQFLPRRWTPRVLDLCSPAYGTTRIAGRTPRSRPGGASPGTRASRCGYLAPCLGSGNNSRPQMRRAVPDGAPRKYRKPAPGYRRGAVGRPA